MAWADTVNRLQAGTHRVFREPAVVSTGAATFEVDGVRLQRQQAETIVAEVGYQGVADVYELRKQAPTGPHTAEDFALVGNTYGELTFPSGATYSIVFVHQDDRLLYLGLAGPN